MTKEEYVQAVQNLAPPLPDGQQYYYPQQPGGYDYYHPNLIPPEECFMLPASALDEMRRTIELMHRGGNLFEVRLMNTAEPITFTNEDGKEISYSLTYSGTFDSFQSFLIALHDLKFYGKNAAEYRKRGGKLHFYISLQVLSEAYKEDVMKTNQLGKFRKSNKNTRQTHDVDVVGYKNLLFDFDPCRPSGTSSTEQQRQAAEACADAVIKHLSDAGFPTPVKALSGNGYHVMYAVDIKRDKAAETLISDLYRSIQAFVQKFTAPANFSEKVDFDMSFAKKPAQLGKLWGSKAKKGDDTTETPHRWSKMVSVPETLQEVTADQIKQFLDKFPPPEEKATATKQTQSAKAESSAQSGKFDLLEFFKKHSITYSDAGQDGDRHKYIVPCPWVKEHTTTDGDKDAAVFMDNYGALGFNCFHAHCAQRQWHDYRKYYEPDYDKLTYRKCLDVNVNKDGRVTSIKVNPGRLAALIQQDYKYMFVQSLDTDEVRRFFYEPDRGLYVRYSDDKIQGFIRGIIEDISYQTKAAIHDTFYIFTKQLDFKNEDELNKNPLLINFRNGLYDMAQNKMLPHTPDVLSTVQFSAEYDPEKHYTLDDAPVFQKYITSLFDGKEDKIQFMLEFIGGCITNVPGYRFKKTGNAVFLVGASDSGKTQIINLLQYILDKRNCATIKFGRLDERFQSGVLYGKRLIMDAEMSFAKATSIDMFKSLTGGDPIQIEDKNQKPFTAVYNGFLLFAANQLPQWGGDTSRTVTERMIIMKCPNAIPPDKQDTELLDKMKKEINVIISLALDAFREVIKRGYKFTRFAELDDNQAELDAANNTAIEFYEQCCDLLPDAATNPASRYKVKDMYAAYCTWCDDTGVFKQSNKAFKKAVLEHSKTELTQKDCGYAAYAFTLTYDAAFDLHAVPPTYTEGGMTVPEQSQSQPVTPPPPVQNPDDETGQSGGISLC